MSDPEANHGPGDPAALPTVPFVQTALSSEALRAAGHFELRGDASKTAIEVATAGAERAAACRRDDGGQQVYKVATAKPALRPEERAATFVASNETVDRYGDVIRVEGWQLDAFRRNPVLLWGHNSSQPPIGMVERVWVEDDKLMARARFSPEGVDAFADQIWRLLEAGVLRAVSVGFLPTRTPEVRRDKQGDFLGFEFNGQELLELSVVSIPANSEALAVARSMGVGRRDELERIFSNVDEAERGAAARRARAKATLDLLRLGGSGPVPRAGRE